MEKMVERRGILSDKRKTVSRGIPIDDPQEALQFCKWLASVMQAQISTSYNSLDSWEDLSATGKVLESQDNLVKPTLSVVIPVYEEEENLRVLYTRLIKVLEECEPSFEIIFVDDGSRDKSREVLSSIVERDNRVLVIELARNFGHQIAISAGLDYTNGRAVIIMDADLQDPPEVLPKFIEKWREGHEVVYAIRSKRKEGLFKRFLYTTFYRVLQHIASIEIPLDAGDFCIMDRRVVDILVNMPERNRFVRGIRSWVGLDQVGLAYERQARYSGKPKFTMTRLMYLALDGLVSFSYIPLRAITILGFCISFISIILAVGYTIQKLIRGLSPPGFATTIVAIFFLAGIQLVTLGVIGEYIGRIFEEVKRRPLYIVKQVQKLEI